MLHSNQDYRYIGNNIMNLHDTRKILVNKDLLIAKEIYSTPTFVVNGKVLDNKNPLTI